ncbi:hypothetical protein DFS33DRAFT_1119520 [Desarmillaria ectypa]|nr:hypothetical protein DFS33DRAFT_1119520 [Desarmillaria ectypa]
MSLSLFLSRTSAFAPAFSNETPVLASSPPSWNHDGYVHHQMVMFEHTGSYVETYVAYVVQHSLVPLDGIFSSTYQLSIISMTLQALRSLRARYRLRRIDFTAVDRHITRSSLTRRLRDLCASRGYICIVNQLNRQSLIVAPKAQIAPPATYSRHFVSIWPSAKNQRITFADEYVRPSLHLSPEQSPVGQISRGILFPWPCL